MQYANLREGAKVIIYKNTDEKEGEIVRVNNKFTANHTPFVEVEVKGERWSSVMLLRCPKDLEAVEFESAFGLLTVV